MTKRPSASTEYSNTGLFMDAVREIAGEDGLSAVVRLRGGSEIGLPAFAKADHWLTEAIGLQRAEKVCARVRVHDADGRVIGGFRCYLPSGSKGAVATFIARKKAEAEALFLAGRSIAEVTMATGLGDRALKRLRRQLIETQRLQPLAAAASRGGDA